VLAYLSRYTHRVAISNRRLIAADKTGVTFTYKDYRIEGPGRYKAMTLETGEFIRRFLTHVLPKGFHRIRHYGLLASGARADNLATIRILLAMEAPASSKKKADAPAPDKPLRICPCCGSRMIVIETFEGSCRRRKLVPAPAGIDTS
jgi:Putative transposase